MILFLLVWAFSGMVVFFHLLINPIKGVHPAVLRELQSLHTLLLMMVTGIFSITYCFTPADEINYIYKDFIRDAGDTK